MKTKISNSRTKISNQMFNISQTLSLQKSSSNLHQVDDLFFAHSERSVENFLKNSYEKSFNLLDTIWERAIKSLIYSKEKCYQTKSDLVKLIEEDFQQIEDLQKFKLSKAVSIDNIPLVRDINY